MRRVTIAALLVVLFFAFLPAKKKSYGSIWVHIYNIRHTKGQIRITLFNAKKGFPGRARYAIRKKLYFIKKKYLTVIFRRVPFGKYAVSVHHDENSNNKMDTSFFGKPSEGWCVSRNAPSRTFGPPKFRDAAFRLKSKVMKLKLRMRY